jgi:hypothetical protein
MARVYYEDPAIVWAYEIDPVKLGSHLETYSACKPLFQTLRLCHKYGESAPITSLPVEVLKMIEDEIFEAQVAESMPRWEQEYSCFQEQCWPVDHYTFDEIADFSTIINDLELDPHKQLINAIADSGTHESRHNDFRYNWRCKLDPLGGPPPQKNYIGITKNVRNLIHSLSSFG